MINTEHSYWLHGDSKSVISELSDRRDVSIGYNTSPIRQTWIRNYMSYYSPMMAVPSSDTSLTFEGQKGELVKMYTPKARSIVRRQMGVITRQRIAAQTVAFNNATGSDVIDTLKLGNALLDQIIDNEDIHSKHRELIEGGIVCGNWFYEVNWRTDKGEPYTRGVYDEIIYTGGADVSVRSPFDVFYDLTVNNWEDLYVVETRCAMNRWDLIAQHPDLEQEIIKVPSTFELRGSVSWFDRSKSKDCDLIFVYKAYCKPTPALPNGRLVIYCDDQTVFYDGENKYDCIPVIPFMPEKALGANFGYPPLTNILAAQEMLDNSMSAIATNQSQFATQNILVPRNSNINVEEMSGMNFISYSPQNIQGGGKPESVNFTNTSNDTYKFIDVLDKKMEDLSPGINQTLAGAPPPGVTSGVAIATLSANAIESINDMMSASSVCVEKMLWTVVNCYHKFAKTDQYLTMKSPNQKTTRKKFNGDNFKSISGVKIQLVNPILQTVAGRLEIAEKLLTMPREVWPNYVAILEGEPLKNIYKGDLSQIDLVHSENELLFNGEKVLALASDDHGLHAQEHAGLLNDPQVRANGQAVEGILNHILEHKNLAANTDPFFLAMIRTGKVPDMMGMAGGGASPQAPQQQGVASGPKPPKILGAPERETAQPAEDLLKRAEPTQAAPEPPGVQGGQQVAQGGM